MFDSCTYEMQLYASKWYKILKEDGHIHDIYTNDWITYISSKSIKWNNFACPILLIATMHDHLGLVRSLAHIHTKHNLLAIK